MKSIDAGITWSLLESTENFDYITDIEISNNNGQSEVYLGVVWFYQGDVHESEPKWSLQSTDGRLHGHKYYLIF